MLVVIGYSLLHYRSENRRQKSKSREIFFLNIFSLCQISVRWIGGENLFFLSLGRSFMIKFLRNIRHQVELKIES